MLPERQPALLLHDVLASWPTPQYLNPQQAVQSCPAQSN